MHLAVEESAGEPVGLAALVERAGDVEIEMLSAEEYRAASAEFAAILAALDAIPEDELEGGDAVDAELLSAHLRTRRFEIETLRLHEVVPVRYFRLSKTNSLFSRPCAQPDSVVREAVEELERLPEILAHGKRQLTRPARVWTENAIYVAWYAERMLVDDLSTVCVDEPELAMELRDAGERALAAVRDFAGWLESDLLPRSDRSPAWKPEEVEFYQFVHERLDDYGVDAMLRIAGEEEAALLAEMEALATRIHPSGDLATVWELMKEEAPPWDEVPAMARRYVELAGRLAARPGRSPRRDPRALRLRRADHRADGPPHALLRRRRLRPDPGRPDLGLLRLDAARGAADRRGEGLAASSPTTPTGPTSSRTTSGSATTSSARSRKPSSSARRASSSARAI